MQTLRAFEAAARHQSYSGAARELGLTHSAISHRIRELESRQRNLLFRRAGNKMLVTTDGQCLLAQVRAALDLLELAFRGSGARNASPRIKLDVLPAFATRWLGQRLASLRSHMPQLQLEVRSTTELSDLVAEGLDAAIRFGPGHWPDVQAERLSGEVLFPVCTLEYRERFKLREPADLRRCVLLRHPRQPWVPWFRAAGVGQDEPTAGSLYTESALLLQAAAAGEGVALARGLLVLDDLRSGSLVRLFETAIPDSFAYFLVRRLRAFPNPALAEFHRWLLSAITADSRQPAIGTLPDPRNRKRRF